MSGAARSKFRTRKPRLRSREAPTPKPGSAQAKARNRRPSIQNRRRQTGKRRWLFADSLAVHSAAHQWLVPPRGRLYSASFETSGLPLARLSRFRPGFSNPICGRVYPGLPVATAEMRGAPLRRARWIRRRLPREARQPSSKSTNKKRPSPATQSTPVVSVRPPATARQIRLCLRAANRPAF